MRFEDAEQIASELAARSSDSRASTAVGSPFRTRDVGLSERVAMFAPSLGFGVGLTTHFIAPHQLAVRDGEPPRVAVGLTPGKGPTEWKVAVRAWSGMDLDRVQLPSLPARELDVRVTGVIEARKAPSPQGLQRRRRPLRAGYSVGHVNVTAGTLGAFVQRRDGAICMLSNNHVLAHSNMGQRGDTIVQPGPLDKKTKRGNDAVGSLDQFVAMRSRGNRVDAAIGEIHASAAPVDLSLPGIGSVAGSWTEIPNVYDVRKVGRTTGLTTGRLTALNLRNLPIKYDGTIRWFNGVLEVQGHAGDHFSQGGDSGSLVVDADRYAVGLLFAGDAQVTYLNPIDDVLEALKVSLVY